MLQNFSEFQNELSAAGKLIESNRRRRTLAVLLFVLVFGAGYSAQAQNSYFVDRGDDNTIATCDPFTANDCTLRGAIQRANTDGVDSQIQLAIPQNLGQTVVLQLSSLSINNDGTLLITSDPIISGGNGTNRRAVDGGTTVRVFAVNPGANVAFRNIAINNGGFTAPNDGAAIDNNGGTVTIDNCFFGANSATDDGGAIKNTANATMTINNSDFLNNFATTNRGGAIFNEGTLTVTSSLFRGNKGKNGGAIANAGTLTVRNTTISGNDATDSGGGIYTLGGTVSIGNSTITRNRADFPSDGIGLGGGVGKSSLGLTVNVGSSIIAANSNGTTLSSSDFDGVLTSQLGYNILGTSSGTTVTGQTFGNQLDVDPKLLPLRVNGGSLATHALAPNSPAIDKGSQISLPNLTTDNRGLPRRFDFTGITDANTGVDVGAYERQPSDRNNFDFDGDRKTDVAVFRPSNGNWYLNQSTAGFTGVTFGLSTDRITPADYDGDGKTDVAVYRNGIWYLQRSQLGFTGITFGQAGDIPLPGDFDGDGKAEICVFRPTNGTWYYLRSTTGAFVAVTFGQMGDVPVNMDFDGDLKNDIALFRPSVGTWYFLLSTNNQFTAIAFGIAEDKPVPGDFDGDGRTDMAVWRPSAGAWYRLLSSNASFVGTTFGASTDLPVQGDFDGDDKADLAVFRPTSGTWYLQQSTAGFTGIAFGTNGDKPAPSAFVP